MDDKLLEPLKAYKEFYEKEFLRHTEELFDKLVKESGIDPAENRRTVKKYNDELVDVSRFDRTLGSLNVKKTLLIILIVISAIMMLASIALLTSDNIVLGAILLPLGAALIVLASVLLAKKINPSIAAAKKERADHRNAAEKLKTEAWNQMAALNTLFDDNMTKKLIEATVPLLKIDDNFNMRRYDYLSTKYGFGRIDDRNRSTIGILTGEILGNPFVVDRELIHFMGTKTYTGSLYITWTEVKYDSEGNAYTEHHSQTLYASVVKPKPYYRSETRLIYGNDAAPDLHFSRRPAHVEDLSEKQLDRKVKSGVKIIRSKQETDASFTEMGNEEFDALFGAFDRDNEVQFRLLFTPLAQKNMLALLKDADGYGDDFSMNKVGCLNYIQSEHSADWDPNTDPARFRSYSVDLARSQFVNFNTDYFRSLFFDFAPLLSIPLYQQHKPFEYIYKESYGRNYTRHETEYAVNNIGQSAFEPYGAATNSILKTDFMNSDGKSDRVCVTAYAYQAFDRVDFVPTWGNDGELHEVPVDWVEYVPVERESTVMLKELGMSQREFTLNSSVADALHRRNINIFGYGHGILCCKTDDNSDFDSDFEINNKNGG